MYGSCCGLAGAAAVGSFLLFALYVRQDFALYPFWRVGYSRPSHRAGTDWGSRDRKTPLPTTATCACGDSCGGAAGGGSARGEVGSRAARGRSQA